MAISRRVFIGSAAAAATASGAGKMPLRTLGRTGAKVSILAFGAGSRWLAYEQEDAALAALTRALSAGVNYIDTAFVYGNGESERRVGLVLPEWRSRVFVATKVMERGYDAVMRTVEGSLKRLRTDHVNLLHAHDLKGADDLATIEEKGGTLAALYKLREQKVARAIGVTCHSDPQVLATALERHDFDSTQMALNAARSGMTGAKGAFEDIALPVAVRKNMGVTAMKVFMQDKIAGRATDQELVHYAMSLPVHAAVIGMPKVGMIDRNVELAYGFAAMDTTERDRVYDKVVTQTAALVLPHQHVDC